MQGVIDTPTAAESPRRHSNLLTALVALTGIGIGLATSVLVGRFGRNDAPPKRPVFTTTPEVSAPPTPDIVEAQLRHKQHHDESLVNHSAEPLDAEWATKTSGILAEQLKAVAQEKSFRVVNVDCRMTSCVGLLEWDNYDVAFREWSAVLNHPYALRCGVEVFLDQPEEYASAYRTSVVFQCGKTKT